MKFAIDLRTVTFGESGGLAWWLKGTLEQLIRSDTDNEYLIFCQPHNFHLVDLEAPNLRCFTLSAAYHAEQLRDRLDYERDIAAMFRPAPDEILTDFPMHRQAVTVTERLHEHCPDQFTPEEVRRRRHMHHVHQSTAGALVTPCEVLRQELLACPWTDCPVVALSPAPPLTCVAPYEGEIDGFLRRGPYFLYPANLYPHKNHRAVIEAFAHFHARHPGVRFVCTGYPYGWAAVPKFRKGIPVDHLGYLSPQILATVYRRALALVFLSRYETMGLPLLQAFAAGLPALCSDLPALAEVAGDAALRCDPTDVQAMADGMARIAFDGPLRQMLVANGWRRMAAFSWQKSADALRAALERVGRSQPRQGWRAGAAPPLVSVVTPSYNQGRFIRETIESVLSQDYPHIDFRVVDGGSTDQTLDVLRSYGDRFPWLSEKDRGQTHAINKGLAQAKGQIQTYLNSDDILRPGAVSKVVKHFLARPACDMVYGRDAYIDPEGEFLGWFPTKPYSFETLIENCCVSQPAAFWRDRIAKLAGPFDESLFSIMDYEYWMRLDRAGAVIEYIPELLASTRIHAEAKTSGNSSYLHRRFREMFTRSMRHAGYFSKTNLRDYLVNCVFKDSPILRHFPGTTAEVITAWHTYRHFAKCRPTGSVARTVERTALSLVGLRDFSLITWVRDKFRRRNADNNHYLPPVHWGPWLHNLLGRRVIVAAAMDRGTDELRVAGRPLCDTTLSLKIGNKTLAEVRLRACEKADLRVRCPLVKGDKRRITLEFTGGVRCPVRGDYAFELHGTNLFGERRVG